VTSSSILYQGRSLLRENRGLYACIFAAVLCASTTFADAGRPVIDISLMENSYEAIVLEYSFGAFESRTVTIDGTDYYHVSIGDESQIVKAGSPDLPNVCRSVIIPDSALMDVKISDCSFYEIEDIDVAPSKGYISHNDDPESVPYAFGSVYDENADYPGELATLGEPYVLRDQRGMVVQVNPFQYNPVRRTLRVYTEMTVTLVNVGSDGFNVANRARERELSRSFHDIYQSHFLNYDSGLRYAPLNEIGEMLVICYDAWMPNMQPFVDHKNDIGISTTMVGVSTIGNNHTTIKNFIQQEYNQGDLAFVLLIGDIAQIDSPTAVSGYSGASDPKYSLLDGGDNYPDIIVGRFSAQNSAEVDTQVQRTIEYETMPATLQDWFWKGMGVAGNTGSGIGDEGQADNVHMDEIRGWLLNYGYTEVDQIYDPYATSAMVASGLNEGRGIVNYCGHGSPSGWGSSGFSSSGVNNLVNDNMLPFIVSVACNNGEFDSYSECFAEAWLRADHNGEPTGAIGCYASSISQPWAPPMEAQDEFALLYTAGAYHSYGALCYAGSCSMMDDYAGSGESWGTGAATFNTWILFGDPSLRIVGVAEPATGLKVEGEDVNAAGPRGGPFTPDQIVFTLENKNETPMDYEVTADVAWVDIADAAGVLPALGTTDVVVSFNAEAELLLHGVHAGVLSFTNLTDHEGDAQRSVALDVDDMQLRISFPLNEDPGWDTEGQWGFGAPQRGGSHAGDPGSGATGDNVYGYNLAGDYSMNMPEYYLTTHAFDCSAYDLVELRFQRWLGVERFDRAAVEASNDGVNWTEIWVNPAGTTISDGAWSLMTLDISGVADGQPTVYIRWAMGPTDSSVTYPGWNIDDVEIWGVINDSLIPGDLDGDGDVDLADLAQLLGGYGTPSGATYEQGDIDGDGDVDLADLAALLGNYGLGG